MSDVVELEANALGKRSAPRLRVRLPGKSITREGSSRISIVDISRHGLLAEMERPRIDAVPGKEMLVHGPGLEVFGVIRRTVGIFVAMEFYDPLSNGQIAALRLLNEQTPSDEQRLMLEVRDWVSGANPLGLR